VLFSKRSSKKDTAANKLTVSAGGHVPFGSDYETTAKRELQEELGINLEIVMLDKFYINYGSEREVIGIFAGLLGNSKLKPNIEEVAGIERFDLRKVIKAFTEGSFDLSGGSRDSFKHLINTGKLLTYWNNYFK
jgi:isopentenyldiphosphate isomerase